MTETGREEKGKGERERGREGEWREKKRWREEEKEGRERETEREETGRFSPWSPQSRQGIQSTPALKAFNFQSYKE